MRFLRTLGRFLVSVQLLPALEGGEETLVGGQAVLEGVMMRSPHAWAIACRKPSGEVLTHSERLSGLQRKINGLAGPEVVAGSPFALALPLGFVALRSPPMSAFIGFHFRKLGKRNPELAAGL